MKKIFGLLLMFVSLHLFAGITNVDVQGKEPVDIKLEKGTSTDRDTYPRTLIPITCVYVDGMVQLTFLADLGEYTLTVTNQTTGACWSAENAMVLETSTASGTYWVEIAMEDGTLYYGTYTL